MKGIKKQLEYEVEPKDGMELPGDAKILIREEVSKAIRDKIRRMVKKRGESMSEVVSDAFEK